MTTLAALATELDAPVEAVIELAAQAAPDHDHERIADHGDWEEWRPEVTDWPAETLSPEHAEAVRVLHFWST